MSARYSATRTSLRTGAIMVLFTLVFTALMASTCRVTQPAIEASKQEAQQRLINEVLPPGSYDNDLLADMVRFDAPAAIGMDEGARVWRARKGGEPVALVIEGAATDGYAGRIELVVAIGKDGLPVGRTRDRTQGNPGPGRLHRPEEGPPQGRCPGSASSPVATLDRREHRRMDRAQGRRQLRLPRRRHHQRARRHARGRAASPPSSPAASTHCSPPPPAACWENES